MRVCRSGNRFRNIWLCLVVGNGLPAICGCRKWPQAVPRIWLSRALVAARRYVAVRYSERDRLWLPFVHLCMLYNYTDVTPLHQQHIEYAFDLTTALGQCLVCTSHPQHLNGNMSTSITASRGACQRRSNVACVRPFGRVSVPSTSKPVREAIVCWATKPETTTTPEGAARITN